MSSLPEEIRLSEHDMGALKGLVDEELRIRKKAQEDILRIAKKAERRADKASERLGVDIRKYDLQWPSGVGRLKEKFRDGENGNPNNTA